jgi:hypothetical protein
MKPQVSAGFGSGSIERHADCISPEPEAVESLVWKDRGLVSYGMSESGREIRRNSLLFPVDRYLFRG